MATKRTWLWILAGVVGVFVIGMMALAAFGVYFVSSNVTATRSTSAAAFRAFDAAAAAFKDEKPLYELDNRERPQMTRRLADMPTAGTRPEHLWILAWDPDDERLLRLSLPFWLLKLGRQKIDVMDGSGFDLERLQLDVHELERVGPLLVFDYRAQTGERVLVWTH